jgi:putative ATPase
MHTKPANTNNPPQNIPLAARMRPRSLDEFIGQKHLVGKDKPIRRLIEIDDLVSMIFWGPPGSGKTTLARIIASETKSEFVQISAVESGKDDLRRIVSKSKEMKNAQESIFRNKADSRELPANGLNRTILFIDEIHRFNKTQQDYLLPFVENGIITLIGATTENPSFEVISPLLSRCRVFVLNQHTPEDIKKIIKYALEDKERGLGKLDITIKKDALEYLSQAANGDPRTALNALELAVKLAKK